MGASNFHSVNACKIYAVLMSYEQSKLDEEGNETGETEMVSPESWEIDDFITELKLSAEKLALENKVNYYATLEMNDPHELRSYPSTELFQIYQKKSFGDMSVQVNVNCILRSAYHDGATLDYFTTSDISGSPEVYEDCEFVIDEHQTYMNAGLRAIQSKNLQRWAEKTKERLEQLIETLFENNSTPLSVTARFSNGETVYSKIN